MSHSDETTVVTNLLQLWLCLRHICDCKRLVLGGNKRAVCFRNLFKYIFEVNSSCELLRRTVGNFAADLPQEFVRLQILRTSSYEVILHLGMFSAICFIPGHNVIAPCFKPGESLVALVARLTRTMRMTQKVSHSHPIHRFISNFSCAI